MAVTVITKIDQRDGEELVMREHEKGYGITVDPLGHLFVYKGSGDTIAVYAPGQWLATRTSD